MTCPSSTTPNGPKPGLSNDSSLCVCVLVTSMPANTRSDITTRMPHPRDSGLVATRTAAPRFAGPSHPRSLDVRIAPVNTTGFSLLTERATT